MNSPTKVKNIVVLGGGFAGVYTVIRLEKALRSEENVRITLVSNENFFLYTPMLHEVATGGIETRHIAYPIRKLRHDRKFGFQMGNVLSVDMQNRKVILDSGPLDYDYLVLAMGATANMSSLPNKSENIYTLKNLLDGVMIRNHIIRMFEQADGENDPKRQKQMLTFAVVGAGYTGVQLAADIQNFVRRCLKGYRRIDPAMVRVILVGDKGHILSGQDKRLSESSLNILRKQGVHVRLNTRVTRVWDHGMELNHSEMEPTETVIWATGIVANPVVAALPVDRDELGRVVVDQFLRVPGKPGVYALGDNAHFADPLTGAVLPPRAHFAVRQPRIVVTNLLADIKGGPSVSYKYQEASELVSLGPRNAAMNLYGLHMSGLIPRFIWLVGYLSIMMGPYNRTRVMIDWFLGLIYDRDTTLLGFRR